MTLLDKIWPFRIFVEKRSSLLTLDEAVFSKSKSKEVKVWSWKSVKTVKYIVHYEQGQFVVKRLD
jgi:hypothetical protein